MCDISMLSVSFVECAGCALFQVPCSKVVVEGLDFSDTAFSLREHPSFQENTNSQILRGILYLRMYIWLICVLSGSDPLSSLMGYSCIPKDLVNYTMGAHHLTKLTGFVKC